MLFRSSMNRIQAENASGKVPDAPFKKNWHELATKKLMNYAIENGYDKVAFTPGAEQNKRYSLTKVANAISYHPDEAGRGMFLNVLDKNNKVIYSELTPENELPNVIGKETAAKLLNQTPVNGNRVLTGLDLEVGGEGMIGFYDKIIPNYLNNEYGKYGVQVETMPIQTVTEWDEIPSPKPEFVNVHSFNITPQMREAIEAKGQPLYQAVGVGLTGAAAAPKEEVQFSDNPDTMMMEMEDRGFAGGGLLKKALKGSQKILPAAEREANKEKFLEPSAIKDRVYHGTSADISEFNPSKIGAMGPGTYVTTIPKTADSYADLSNKSPNVLPLHVQLKNPFPISSVMKSGAEFFTHFDPTGKLSDKQVVELAKKAGYDAVHAIKEGELNVFEPSKIKSAIGNRGTYDITDPDINKAQGGLTKAKRK